ncbi:hypothetical protein H0H92_000257 [Tricholoma furcatifolium]|nr:hypothetical protein H0H92_000257 [Tricholoma furcatifolium]
MRLPRRVPWASITELEQICAWIYTDENDTDAKILAINRLSAWRAITYLPHALESALSLLTVIVQDSALTPQPVSLLSLRQSYSTAIIRLVNGLVDPLQLGAYARSIASIASQLGLPSWLVELRHAATHEDLPSLELLREAARESMVWLLHNYFLPTINPATLPEKQTKLRSLSPLLKEYKRLLKITTRDASLRAQYKPEIASVFKDIERWIAEARVAANMATREIGWVTNALDISSSSGYVDPKERWALEKLCDSLIEKGSIVPLSKKKREFPTDSFLPPKFSVLLWTPLLHHLQSLHPEFYGILTGRIISVLLPESPLSDVSQGVSHDLSYDECLVRWVRWAVDAWSYDESSTNYDLRKEVTVTLMQSLGHISTSPSENDRLGSNNFENTLDALKSLLSEVKPSEWGSEDITLMDHRLKTLLSSNVASDPLSRSASPVGCKQMSAEIVGWRVLDKESWRPCPIGTHFAPG